MKINEQKICFEALKNEDKTAIFFESPRRIEKTVKHLEKFLNPKRQIVICKEMTKLHEQILRDDLSNILLRIQKKDITLKGEMVLVIEGSRKKNIKFDQGLAFLRVYQGDQGYSNSIKSQSKS